jgi:hypothetical protein
MGSQSRKGYRQTIAALRLDGRAADRQNPLSEKPNHAQEHRDEA